VSNCAQPTIGTGGLSNIRTLSMEMVKAGKERNVSARNWSPKESQFLRPFGRRGQERGYGHHRYVRCPLSQEATHDRDFVARCRWLLRLCHTFTRAYVDRGCEMAAYRSRLAVPCRCSLT
jgi:hypothetical protein